MWGFLLIPGSRHEVGWDFLLVQQQRLYPYPLESCPHCHFSLMLKSHHVVHSWWVGLSLLGLALVKLEKEIWEKVFPEHTHTLMRFMSPQHRDHNQTQSRRREWDQRGHIHSHKLPCGVCVSIWYSSSFRTGCRIPSSLFAGKSSNLLGFYLKKKKRVFQPDLFGNGVKL